MEELTDREIRVNWRAWRIAWYRCAEHGGWRCEAAQAGRVVEVIDVPREGEALSGMVKVLSRRRNGKR